MQSPNFRLVEQIWDIEELLGMQHCLQTKEQFIKQHIQTDEIELAVRLLDLDRVLTNKNVEIWKEIISDHFNHLLEKDKNEVEPKAEAINFWLSKYIKLLPTALRDEIIDEEEACVLLEASGDHFSGYESEQSLTDAWLPWNAILERMDA